MGKEKYYYDTSTLSYKRIQKSTASRLRNILAFLGASFAFGAIIVLLMMSYFDSPKEKQLKREIQNMKLQYEIFNEKIDRVEAVLGDIQERDNNIYRVIFEADPIPSSIREAGFGGINRYEYLEGFDNSSLIKETARKLDQVTKQLYVQSISFDEVIDLARNKTEMLASIPAIQPVANQDLTRVASGYGFRIHPIYKTRKFHYGMDFTAPTGTEVYATGNARVKAVKRSRRGFGNHIILDHGFGYETIYAHLSAFNVRQGQIVERGDVIGFVGSTGTSTAPHLHYEVHKNGERINPVNFYYNDLSPEEYDRMIYLSSRANQSFD